MDYESAFVQQFTGSATANMAFAVVFFLYMGLKKLCERDSKCKSKCHTPCIDVSVRDNTIRELP